MSKLRKEIITCPLCETKGDFTLWESINVDLDPEMRDIVQSDKLFWWTCPNCGEVFSVPYSTLYHDMKRKFMVLFEPERKTNALGVDSKYGLKDYIYRFSCGKEDFMDKIRQLESGLDDKVLEVIKMLLMREHCPSDMSEKTIVRFEGLKKDDTGKMTDLSFRFCDQGKEVSIEVNSVFYDKIVGLRLAERVFQSKVRFCEISQYVLYYE